MIQRVQRRAIKLVPSISNLDYDESLVDFKSKKTLVARRQREDAIQIYKLMHNNRTANVYHSLPYHLVSAPSINRAINQIGRHYLR